MATNLLEVQHLTKAYKIGGMFSRKKMRAVDDVSFAITDEKPVILSIVGESGCGKTTMARMILRLIEPSEGKILIGGKNALSKKEISSHDFRNTVQTIFQNPFDAFSSRRQVIKYLLDTAKAFGGCKTSAEAVEAASKALKSVGLDYSVVEGKYPSQFSGGELQRIAIARALITSPKLIVADEPVAMIDASLKINIVNLFKELKDKYGISFVYITHDLSTAYYVSDYIATLYRGNLVEFGDAKEVMENPAHPYTQLLLSSVPRVGEKWDQSDKAGETESREYAMSCCRFQSRCPYATDECRKKRPEALEIGRGRKVSCYHPLVTAQDG